MTAKVDFDSMYQEQVRLKDGTYLCIRPVCPSDKDIFLQGFEHLSAESRYLRFCGLKTALSEHDLLFLTEVDNINHFAVVAVHLDEQGREGEGVGVARFLRLRTELHTAEFAVTVIDKMHGKGIGKLLCQRLVAAAPARGIQRFCCYLLVGNNGMRQLVHHISQDAIFQQDGAVMTAEFSIAKMTITA